jgi:OOP family OmpA-OmpF porin
MRLPRARGPLVAFLLSFVVCLGLAALAPPAAAAGRRAAAAEPEDDDDEDALRDFRAEFGLFGGWHYFDSESGLGRYTTDPPEWSPKSGFALGGRLALNFNRWVSIEGEALWIPTHTVLDPGGTDINVFAYRGSLVVHFIGTGAIRPFILAGYGGTTSVSNDNSIVPGDTDGTLHGGLGVKLGGERFGVRIEGRVLAPPAFLGNKIPVGDEIGFHGPDMEALLGLYLRFGEVERVEKVVVKEVKQTVVQKPAAPINPDPDGDGISNKADKCPDVAEDKDGFEDEDGCPDPDNDKDGIPDAQDKCPNKPETVNNIDDDDGCPEVDTDGDGFLGSRDKCPDEPETKNGYKDDDGCPDEIPQAVKKFTGVIEGINFKSGQAAILAGSYVVLDRALAVLKEYPDIRLEISGHTDSRGKADFNRDLSQRRADAVKLYFISRGIDANRLTSIGYGPDRPIADNGSDAGRSRNRRTEFRLLTSDDTKPH